MLHYFDDVLVAVAFFNAVYQIIVLFQAALFNVALFTVALFNVASC